MDAYRKPDPERLREQDEQAAEEERLRELEQDAAEEERLRARALDERLRAVEEERQRRELAWESERRTREEEAEAEWRQRDMVPASWKSTWAVALPSAYVILWMAFALGGPVWLRSRSQTFEIINILLGLGAICLAVILREPPESRD